MNPSYPFKHWLATLILGPIFLIIYDLLLTSKEDAIGVLKIYILFLFYGIPLSFPAYLVYSLLFKTIGKRLLPKKTKKAVLIGTTIICIAIIFLVIRGSMTAELIISYSLATITAGLMYPIHVARE